MTRQLPLIDGWIRVLEGDRLEVFLKAERIKGEPDRKIRASGPTQEMYELVDWFEDKTGLTVAVPNRVRTGPRPLPGQASLELLTDELPSKEGAVS